MPLAMYMDIANVTCFGLVMIARSTREHVPRDVKLDVQAQKPVTVLHV